MGVRKCKSDIQEGHLGSRSLVNPAVGGWCLLGDRGSVVDWRRSQSWSWGRSAGDVGMGSLGGRVVSAVTVRAVVGLIALIGCGLDAGLVVNWALVTNIPILVAVVAGYVATRSADWWCGNVP